MITAGSRWVQVGSGRIIIVIDPEYEDVFVQWHYADEPSSQWHYSDCHGFIFGGEYIPEAKA